LLVLKQIGDGGNPRARKWSDRAQQRLLTQTARQLAEAILATDADEWWQHVHDATHQ